MRAFTTLIALAVAAVSAQFTSKYNYTSSLGLVAPQRRAEWCQGQTNTCLLLCKRINENSCNIEDLSFQCKCASNNSAPGLEYYTQTLPTYKCEFAFEMCDKENTSNADGQKGCINNIQKFCGTLAPPSASVSSAGGSDGDSSNAPTGAATASTASKGRTGGSVTSSTSGGLAAPTMAPASNGAAAAAAIGFLAYLI